MIKEYPKVAVLILNWNNWVDTIECLESVFRINYPNYQVIIIDNGSTDNSVDKIIKWAEGKQETMTPLPSHPLYYLSHPPVLKPILYIEYDKEEAENGGEEKKEIELSTKLINGKFKSMIIIRLDKNLGFSAGNNVGIKYVLKKNDYDYIWILNNDVVVDKDSLLNLMKEINKYPNVGITGSKIYYYSEPKKISHAGGAIRLCVGISKHIGDGEYDINQYNSAKFVDYVTGASIIISIRLLRQIGYFYENYFLYYEDTDLCVRARKKKWNILYVPDSKIWHKISNSPENSAAIQNYYFTRNRLIFIKRNYPFCIIFVGLATLRYSIFNNLIKKRWKHLLYGLRGIIDFIINKGNCLH